MTADRDKAREIAHEHVNQWTDRLGCDDSNTHCRECEDLADAIATALSAARVEEWQPDPNDKATIDYAMHYGSGCRDCADADGVCPTSGNPCDPDVMRSVIKHTLAAIQYGLKHGYLPAIRTDGQAAVIRSEVPARGIPDGWLVIGAEAHNVFGDKLQADTHAGKWGKVLPLYRGQQIPDHAFIGNAPGVVGADNCQICGVWYDKHPTPGKKD